MSATFGPNGGPHSSAFSSKAIRTIDPPGEGPIDTEARHRAQREDLIGAEASQEFGAIERSLHDRLGGQPTPTGVDSPQRASRAFDGRFNIGHGVHCAPGVALLLCV